MDTIKKSLVLIVAVNSVLSAQPACAMSEATATHADVQLKQVALFKNGLGFFVSHVACPDDEDSFSFVPVGAASHGTFWVSYPTKVEVKKLTAKETGSEELVEVITIPELLRANVGREVGLQLGEPSKREIEGVIKCFPDDREKRKPPPQGYGMGTYTYGRANYSPVDDIQPTSESRLIVIETDGRDVAIDPLDVKTVEFLGSRADMAFRRKAKSVQLDVCLSAAAGGEKLVVSYLAKGITWAPSYMVDIADPDRARMSAKAAVINEVCDLEAVTVQLVTGVPHLKFADAVSPLALKQTLVQFLQSLAWVQSDRRRPEGVMSQIVGGGGYGGFGGYGVPLAPEYGTAEEGQVAEDLFLYSIANVQLKKGEVGYYPLFTESVSYKHIYQWKIPDYVDEKGRYFYDRRRDEQREPKEEVWHCLRLENSTKVPWTTAPAETVKDGLILGQDTLIYTPVQGETTLRITQAVNVKAEQLELETARKREALILYGDYFDLITVDGKLSATNFLRKTITLEVIKTLSGDVKSSQPKAKIETLARGLQRMNAVRKLTWTIELKPGEQKQLGYVYEVYVRR